MIGLVCLNTVRETISVPASTSPQPSGSFRPAASTTQGPVTNGKEIANWVNEDRSAIGYIKIKCTEVIVAGLPATADTSKKVWDDLKEKYDKASAVSVLMEICKVFSF